jgi:hypothetical protein
MDADPIILSAPRFADSFSGASASIQRLAYAEVHNFVRRYRAAPHLVANRYDRVEQLKPEVVVELELGGGPRLLGHWRPGVLTLLEIGEHDKAVPRYEKSWLQRELADAGPADRNFFPATSRVRRFFVSNPDKRREMYGNEVDPGWIYVLTDQQRAVVAKIEQATKRSSKSKPLRFFIVGGPGTGKTSILTKLLIDLRAQGHKPGLIVSDEVAHMIEQSGAINLDKSRLDISDLIDPSTRASSFDVALFDDPQGVWAIERLCSIPEGLFRTVVIAFDPCQLDASEDLTTSMYEALVGILDAKPYELKVCYRQKENLGRAAKRVMDAVAASTPFLADRKIEEWKDEHSLVYRLSNDLKYPNHFGYEQIYEAGTLNDVKQELARIRSGPLWHHSAPLLLVVQAGTVGAKWTWPGLLKGIDYTFVELRAEEYADLNAVKGLEFQHAFLVIGKSLFDELENGFKGTGQGRYHRRRLLRIPFSRAKDSLVTFVTADE